MLERGWAGDPNDVPWWGVFVFLAAILAATGLYFGVSWLLSSLLGESNSGPMATVVCIAVMACALPSLLRWMYGPNREKPPAG